MLQSLALRDFVIVDRLEIHFSNGFTVLTGETGAGKSLLADALALAVGDRADAGVIRAGSQRCEIEAVFDADGSLQDWLIDQGLDDDGLCVMRRLIDAGGRSRCFINGRQVTLQQLREAGEFLVDLHGQHAHQSLLKSVAQRQILDAFAGATVLAQGVAEAYRDWQSALQTLAEAERVQADSALEAERLRWQVEDLQQLGFHADQWETLQAEHDRMAHAAQLANGLTMIQQWLVEGEPSVDGLLQQAVSQLESMLAWDARLQPAHALLSSMQAELGETLHVLRYSAEHLDVDAASLQDMEQRIAAVISAARKYRVQPHELAEVLATACQRLSALETLADTTRLAGLAKDAEAKWRAQAMRLSDMRQQAADRLSTDVSELMQQLALAGGVFRVGLEPVVDGYVGGLEQVTFLVASHSTAELRPLAKVASGGELSRISLALQTAVSRVASVPVLVFDEVDVGIGGGVAEMVGRLLRQLAQSRQVICITHLPQVAALGQHHLQVSKSREQDGIISQLTVLDAEGRVEEVSRMLGGVQITEATRAHAREMLRIG